MAAEVADIAGATVAGIRRIVAGEQNEVYDVALERGEPLIARISHRGSEAHEREIWVLDQCGLRGIRAPRVHALRQLEVGGASRSLIVMDKLPGERLSDIDPSSLDLPRVLGEIGAWLKQLHLIPVQGFGYLDGTGVGYRATIDEWRVDSLDAVAPVFEEAGRSVGMEAATIRAWLAEAIASFRATSPPAVLVHNDLLANHVLVHEGQFSGIIDFGEVAAEPAAIDFARWDFNEGERFPVQLLMDGYGDTATFEATAGRTYRAAWLATGLWLMRWYHETGFLSGVEAARDRLLSASTP